MPCITFHRMPTPTNGEPEQYVAQSLGTFPTTIVSTTSTDLKRPEQYIYTPHLDKVNLYIICICNFSENSVHTLPKTH